MRGVNDPCTPRSKRDAIPGTQQSKVGVENVLETRAGLHEVTESFWLAEIMELLRPDVIDQSCTLDAMNSSSLIVSKIVSRLWFSGTMLTDRTHSPFRVATCFSSTHIPPFPGPSKVHPGAPFLPLFLPLLPHLKKSRLSNFQNFSSPQPRCPR